LLPPEVAKVNLRSGIGIAVAVLVLCGACSGKQRDAEPKARPVAAGDSIVRLGPWRGTLPCADCSGIRTELTLFAVHPSGEPVVYHLSETYLGTPDGDRVFTSAGRWATSRGLANDAGAVVVQIAFDKPDEQRSFRRLGEDTLRLLDRSQAEIASNLPYTLVRSGAGGAPPPVFVAGEHPPPVTLRLGQELLLRLPANRATGFQWALADTTRDVVATQSTLYVQDTVRGPAVGVGGKEYWRLRAVGPGERTLLFVYQRPWEKQAQPARTAELHVSVR
jgi:predicted secreted protein/uncharacterized lipoprotein NlpE involved in copper resistance